MCGGGASDDFGACTKPSSSTDKSLTGKIDRLRIALCRGHRGLIVDRPRVGAGRRGAVLSCGCRGGSEEDSRPPW